MTTKERGQRRVCQKECFSSRGRLHVVRGRSQERDQGKAAPTFRKSRDLRAWNSASDNARNRAEELVLRVIWYHSIQRVLRLDIKRQEDVQLDEVQDRRCVQLVKFSHKILSRLANLEIWFFVFPPSEKIKFLGRRA